MEIECAYQNNFNKNDWHINILPVFNFGNMLYGKGIVINIGWMVWFLNIGISIKTKKTCE